MKRSKVTLQQAFRSKCFSYNQYWKVQYVLFGDNYPKTEYISVIKSRSAVFCKDILEKKIEEEDSSLSISNIRINMFHKGFCFKRSNKKSEKLINIEDWSDIKKCSFI